MRTVVFTSFEFNQAHIMQGLIGSHPKRLFSVALSTTNPTSPMWRPSALHEKHILLFDSVCIPDLTHLTSLYPTCSYFICPSPVLSAPPSVHQTELTRSRLLPLTVCRELLKNYSESKLHAGLGPDLHTRDFCLVLHLDLKVCWVSFICVSVTGVCLHGWVTGPPQHLP